MNLIGNAATLYGKAAGRLHLGLRGQILLLGVAGVLVVGAINLAGLQVEERSQREAERFGLAPLVFECRLAQAETIDASLRASALNSLAADSKQAGLPGFAMRAARLEAGPKSPERVGASNAR